MDEPTELLVLLNRLWDAPLPPRKISPATQAAYEKDLRRLFTGGTAIAAKATAYRYRAALTWFLGQLRETTLSDFVQTGKLRHGRVAPEQLSMLRILVDLLDRFPPGSYEPPPLNAADQPVSDLADGVAHSKRDELALLPPDWRERLFDVTEDDEDRAALAILISTGLRPSEFERGVRVQRACDENALIFHINGSKVTETNGQPIRRIGVLIQGDLIVRAIEDYLCVFGAGDDAEIDFGADRLRRLVQRAADEALPVGAPRPTPLSFRHQLAADLKADGLASEVIAAFLGHRSVRTQGHYGRRRDGIAGNRGVANVWAVNPVRARTRSHIVLKNITGALVDAPKVPPGAQSAPQSHPAAA
ncbi:site-specific integrase [Niveibacterium sp. 24ML]|uniref:site-specific integrase n=1 Tax=Niveibacterium sp. 24ML TaxID=2985512 RepID=UPI00226E9B62|nr:site-specific integrase [Niveibacterium sp. 24ML]MCX9157282.1 site-specific integrase [Niveibacterium sp. 24ML]